MPDILKTIGRYELLDLLGKGGFGSVYRAQVSGPMGFVEEVAVKVVHPSLAKDDPDALLALADEARILSRLRHPNIVGLRSFEKVEEGDDVQHLLVLEFVRGVTLDDILRVLEHLDRALPLPAILLLWSDVLAGLHHAHTATGPDGEQLGLVHRDLKPPNVMVDDVGNVRILDFGIAYARERLVRTMVGITKGSPPWMSPEQIRGHPQDGRSDLWVLGTVIYRLISGQWWIRPISRREETQTVMDLIAKKTWADRKTPFVDALARKGRLPARRADRKALEELFASMLAHEPDKRPIHAEAVRQRVRSLAAWDEAAGREVLSRVCRGILKTGKAQPGPEVPPTRSMRRDERVTTPGAPAPWETP